MEYRLMKLITIADDFFHQEHIRKKYINMA